MAEKLSQRPSLSSKSEHDDFVHVVRSGASYKMLLSRFFDNPRIYLKITAVGFKAFIFRDDIENNSALPQSGDMVIVYSTVSETMIIGVALVSDTITQFPDDYRDPEKFMRFFDGTAML